MCGLFFLNLYYNLKHKDMKTLDLKGALLIVSVAALIVLIAFNVATNGITDTLAFEF